MKNDFFKKIKVCTPHILLVLIIVLPWFLKPGYLFLTDTSWGPNMNLPDWTSGGIYLSLIIKGLSFLIPISLLEKLFITVVLGIILFGGYKITRSLTHNKLILFLGSTFALFNPFVYDRLMYGQIGVILSYGLFLAAFGYLLSSYFSLSSKKQLFLSSVFGGLSILFAPHFVFFIGVLYLVFGILVFVKVLSKKDQRRLLKVFTCFLLSILIIGAINFNWLLGVALGSSDTGRSLKEKITEQDLIAFRTRGETKLEVIENVFLMSGFWGMEQYRYESLKNIKENWGRSFYFLLPIIVWGVVANFKNREKRRLKIGLLTLYIIGFVLALGIALPITSKITLWLFNNVPFYRGLREPQKWVAVMVPVYEVFLVLGLVEFFKKKIVIKNKELATLLLAFLIFLQAPLLAWGGAGQIRPVEYPQDWYETNDLIVKETDCQNKILFLPWHLYMGFKWIGKIVVNPAPKFFECPVVYGKNMEFGGIYSQSLDPGDRKVEEWLFSFGKTNLLEENELDIGYIILAKEVDWQNYLWIGNHPNVEFVKETENLIVYRVHPVK